MKGTSMSSIGGLNRLAAMPMAAIAMFAGSAATAQVFDVTYTSATIDRWWYPFNSQVGSEASAPTFGAILQTGFDDRDAQFVLAFDTGSQIASGNDPSSYLIDRLRLTVYVSVNNQFNYDPSWDSVTTLYADGDPAQTVDADVGKPVELFAAGYRNGVTALSLMETTPHSTLPPFPPTSGVRSVYAAMIDAQGQPTTDISQQVRQRFEAMPMAIGMDIREAGLQAGADVPEGTPLSFDVDMNQPGVREYFQNGLSQGRIVLVVTSLAPASGGPGGGTGSPRYPAFYTKENALVPFLGYHTTLELGFGTGCPTCAADYDNNGGVDGGDLAAFFTDFEAGAACADVDQNGGVDGGDLGAFFQAFEAGGC